MSFDGLSAITAMNSPKLKYISICQEKIGLELMNAVAMNAEQKVKIPKSIHRNKAIEKSINETLKMKFEFSCW